jgi:hypothetical protein
MTDIVKYQNELNTNTSEYPVFKLTEVEQNIFMVILSHTTFNDSQWIELNLLDLKNKISYWRDSMTDFTKEINSLLDKICNPKVKIETENSVHIFTCFDELKYDKTTYDLKLHVQDTFYNMVKNYQLGFTRFELAEFVSLSGAYAKTLYRLLKQFKSQGWWYVELDDFKRLLNIPDTYQMCDLNKRVLNPCIKQLSRESDMIDEISGSKRIPFQNLSVRKIAQRKRGQTGRGAITALKFTFEPQKDLIPESVPDRQPQPAAEPQAPQTNSNLAPDHQEPAPDFSEFAQEKSTYTVEELKQLPAGEFALLFIQASKERKDQVTFATALAQHPEIEEIQKIVSQIHSQKKAQQLQQEIANLG